MSAPHRASRTDVGEAGWVMVPVIALLMVALGLGFALLAVVDTQTRQSRQQRTVDAAQTLAEGAAAAATAVLATDQTASAWPVNGRCRTISHRLSDPITGQALDARIASEIANRFKDSSDDLSDLDEQRTTYALQICPVQGAATSPTSWTQDTETRWTPAFLTRTVTAPAGIAGPDRVALWIRVQANVRTDPAQTARVLRSSRSIATKIVQTGQTWAPPTGYALGTGGLSTDLASTLSSTLLNNGALTGKLLGATLGTKALIGDAPAKIGTRCSLLSSLSLQNLSSLCLSGTLAGAGTLTKALGLGQLNTLLGIDNQTTLGTWAMAPADVAASYRRDAQRFGVHKTQVPGAGDVRTRTGSGGAPPCLSATDAATTAAQVIYIDRVGDGEQYCTLQDTTAKIVIVDRGGLRIAGNVRAVIYARNLQECAALDGTCTPQDRNTARSRELVRIIGNTGNVTGAVWVDGAGGQTGTYPGLQAPSSGGLLGIGGTQNGICSTPILGPLLGSLTTTLRGVLDIVGNLLGGLLGSQEQVRYVDASGNVLPSPPNSCDVLQSTLGSLSPVGLLDLYSTGGEVSSVLTQRRTRSCFIGCGAWSTWSTRDTIKYTLPPLLGTGTQSLIGDVTGLLTATLSRYQAITYDQTIAGRATTTLTTSAGPVPGTYRNDPSIGH